MKPAILYCEGMKIDVRKLIPDGVTYKTKLKAASIECPFCKEECRVIDDPNTGEYYTMGCEHMREVCQVKGSRRYLKFEGRAGTNIPGVYFHWNDWDELYSFSCPHCGDDDHLPEYYEDEQIYCCSWCDGLFKVKGIYYV